MASGMSFNLNQPELRTDSALVTDQKAFTFGLSSFVALPIVGAAVGVGRVASGYAWGAGLDGVGQAFSAAPYNPYQTLTAGTLGGMVFLFATGSYVGNAALGTVTGGTSVSINNQLNDTNESVSTGAVFGLIGGAFATPISRISAPAISRYTPARIGSATFDPTMPALLQNFGKPNPYPAAAGAAIGNASGWGIPFALENLTKDGSYESNR